MWHQPERHTARKAPRTRGRRSTAGAIARLGWGARMKRAGRPAGSDRRGPREVRHPVRALQAGSPQRRNRSKRLPQLPAMRLRASLRFQTERKLFSRGAGPSRHRPKARKNPPDAARWAQSSLIRASQTLTACQLGPGLGLTGPPPIKVFPFISQIEAWPLLVL
jgi:hypothetical protein